LPWDYGVDDDVFDDPQETATVAWKLVPWTRSSIRRKCPGSSSSSSKVQYVHTYCTVHTYQARNCRCTKMVVPCWVIEYVDLHLAPFRATRSCYETRYLNMYTPMYRWSRRLIINDVVDHQSCQVGVANLKVQAQDAAAEAERRAKVGLI
jgi:hypothetical protein